MGTDYREDRRAWAQGQREPFRADVESLCQKLGIELSPREMKSLLISCVDQLRFGYPAEYIAAEGLCLEGQDREEILPYTTDLMRSYRISFAKERKR